MLNSDNLPHELFLTQRRITKSRNNIENNMSSDIKLSKAQIKKIIMSGGALRSNLGKLAGPLLKIATPLATKTLPTLQLLCLQLSTLGSALIENLLSGKGMYRSGKGMCRSGEGIIKQALMPPHPLTNFEIQNCYKNGLRFNGIYYSNSLSKKWIIYSKFR